MIIQIAGYLSGLAVLLSFYPYIRDIFAGKTKPERISWLIWGSLSLTAFFPQLAKGASYSLLMTGAMAVGDILVFILAIKYGRGGFLKRDIFAMLCLAGGLTLWYLTKEAAIALYIATFIDATGTALTVAKSYEDPSSETVSSWMLTFIGGVLACIAVGSFNFVLLIFPFYMALAGLSILIAIYLGFLRKKILNVSKI